MSKKEIKKIKSTAKTKEISKTILSLVGMGSLILLAGGGTRSSKKAIQAWKCLGKYSKWRVSQCLKRLKMQEYINYDEDDLTKPIVLTDKGMQRFAVISLKDKLKSMTMKKWDRIWRLVTFDVLEDDRWKRDRFRKKLLLMDFFKLHQNIYITPFAVEEEILNLAKSCVMKNDILILHVADLGDREEEVKKYFLRSNKEKLI